MDKKKIQFFLKAIGILVFIYILSKIDYKIIFRQIASLKWQFLILTVILMVAEIIFRSLRWRVILSSLGISVSKMESLNLYWLGSFFSVITPGRFGELIKIYFLKNRGGSVFRSFFSILIDRLLDIFILLLFSFLVFLFFLKSVGIYMIFFTLILVVALVFIFLVINQNSFFHRIFGKLIQKIFPLDFSDYSHFTFKKLWEEIKGLKKKQVLYFFVYLAIGWLLYFSVKYTISLSLGLNLSFINLGIVSVLIILANTLPVSIAGLGTREAAIIYFFSLFGINKETALLFSLLVFSADMLIVCFGLIPYMKESALINKVKKI